MLFDLGEPRDIGDRQVQPQMGWEEHNQVEPGASGWPELISRSAPILKGVTFWTLVVAFALPVVAAAFVMACTGHGRLLLGCLALLGLGLGSVVLCLVTRTGRVVLESDRLIEYNQLGYSRTFTYAQIYAVKRGTHADQVWICYYPMSKDGQIDYERTRRTNLIGVHRESKLRQELVQRITAPQPPQAPAGRFVWGLLVLGVFLAAVLAAVFLLFPH